MSERPAVRYDIRRAAVIGAGTMGAGIAAQLANVGVCVDLMDVVPGELTPKERAKGLGLDHPQVRDRTARASLDRVQSGGSPGFYSPRFVARVRPGNIEDHLERVREADWIIEAIVEDLRAKQTLMQSIGELRRPGTIVSTNTSGLRLKDIADGLPDGFRRYLLGTHFFNPPRSMRLLEVIPCPETEPAVLDHMIRFGTEVLGKGVVVCKDTPNFIANRVSSVQGMFDMDYAVRHGYSVEEVDAILGSLIGRPKTAVFRLRDLVGLDISTQVAENLYRAIPQDAYRAILKAPAACKVRQGMIDRGLLGRKSGKGFYKAVETKGGRQFWALDLETLEYREPRRPDLSSIGEASELDDLSERLRLLVDRRDRAGQLVWASLKNCLLYAAYCLPEIADDVLAVDRALRWGYSWELGPFEIWDALGMAETAARMEAEGGELAGWVKDMLDRGEDRFYQRENGRVRYYDVSKQEYMDIPRDTKRVRLALLKERGGGVVSQNASASLIDMGDGVACLEFHTKANALDESVYRLIEEAEQAIERDFLGLIIGNDGRHFSAGGNLELLLERARDGRFDEIEGAVRRSQDARMTLRFLSKPVVAAPFGYAVAGGAEMILAADRTCAAAESHIGLVEVGVGLIPAAGGCKELLRRVVSPAMHVENVEAAPFVRKVFDNIFQSRVSTSAYEARDMGYLGEADPIVMRRDHLLWQAKDLALSMAEAGYRPPTCERSIFVVGEGVRAALRVSLFLMQESGYVLEHGARIGEKLIRVLCGGDITTPQWVDEGYILDLEREAFLSLCGEPATQARIAHFLSTGKRLRN
jgi:3-hydroxyacyl-CoA dehydrogenase